MRSERAALPAIAALLAACAGGHEISTDYIDDEVVARRVENALHRAEGAAFAEVEVRARDGAVRLTGRVPSAEAGAAALRIARGVHGVTSVEGALAVRAPDGGG